MKREINNKKEGGEESEEGEEEREGGGAGGQGKDLHVEDRGEISQGEGKRKEEV